MNRGLNYLGIARKSGGIETGEEKASLAVKAGKAWLLIVAADASDGAVRRAEGYVYETQTALMKVPFTKLEIAEITGKTGCSMAAMTDLGLATAFAKALSDENDDYARAYDELRLMQEQIEKRRADKAGRSRNMGNRRKSV